ncbi:carbon-nitrogen family hydrolase [Paenibacillus sp.]|uniref:carbon-nitrogen family hydrolase n=1 Tax=Paenibacillus sp. TaxID=58172 RepID=UPI002D420F0E|nr:carbon-nitrogen family hydrolase [Paenibacillus sp.]HZG56165.1 carbon-nitrogen family hydrolase [Paenibacillus sp.]
MKVAVIQMDVTIGEPARNRERALAHMEAAVSGGEKPDVLVLPEMWNTGYSLENIEDIADADGEPTHATMSAFAAKHGVNVVAGSVANKSAGGVKNTIFAYDRTGARVSEYSKIHLFRLMEEEKYLQEGGAIGKLRVDGAEAGMMVCYDIRFPELTRRLALDGAKVLFVPAQWPKPRLHHWRTLLLARAIENQMYVVACNRVGISRGTEFFGNSMIISPWGDVLAEGGEEETILRATLDLSEVDRVRKTIPVFEDRRPELY